MWRLHEPRDENVDDGAGRWRPLRPFGRRAQQWLQ
jgi:hypothetical protein